MPLNSIRKRKTNFGDASQKKLKSVKQFERPTFKLKNQKLSFLLMAYLNLPRLQCYNTGHDAQFDEPQNLQT